MSRVFKEDLKGLPFEQGETSPVMAILSTAVAATKSTMLGGQLENVSSKVVSVTTPNEP